MKKFLIASAAKNQLDFDHLNAQIKKNNKLLGSLAYFLFYDERVLHNSWNSMSFAIRML